MNSQHSQDAQRVPMLSLKGIPAKHDTQTYGQGSKLI